MNLKFWCFLVGLFLLQTKVFFSFGQINITKGYFRSPIATNLYISSNLGEIRPNHFHAGLDVSVGSRTGKSLYVVANGYISRIKVSPRGYGNAIYITHPNGYVSVYAHMDEFNKKVRDYVFKLQHERQQFELDIYPSPHIFPLKKGDYIGKIGNTGQSYGAHLHFEIREEESEIPVNPLFVYSIKDNAAPRIKGVYMYQFGQEPGNKRYANSKLLKKVDGRTINTFGVVGFGVEIHDYFARKSSRLGVYQVKLLVDDSLIFSYKMNKISFDESRYINSFIDYKERVLSGKKVTKCFIEPNNKLGIYQTNGSGLYNFSDGKLHTVKIIGKDIKGNAVSTKFYIQSNPSYDKEVKEDNRSVVKHINCKKTNSYSNESISIYFPEDCLYHDIDLKLRKSSAKSGAFSDLYHIHNRYIPIHTPVKIAIKADSIPEKLRSKAVIAGYFGNTAPYSIGGKWNVGYVEAEIKNFGSYYVTVDTIGPSIIPLSFDENNYLDSGRLSFEIDDDLSGIEEYIGFIDDKWVLFEYDEKNRLITCNLVNENVTEGEHFLVLWVKDKCGNISTFETHFSNQPL